MKTFDLFKLKSHEREDVIRFLNSSSSHVIEPNTLLLDQAGCLVCFNQALIKDEQSNDWYVLNSEPVIDQGSTALYQCNVKISAKKNDFVTVSKLVKTYNLPAAGEAAADYFKEKVKGNAQQEKIQIAKQKIKVSEPYFSTNKVYLMFDAKNIKIVDVKSALSKQELPPEVLTFISHDQLYVTKANELLTLAKSKENALSSLMSKDKHFILTKTFLKESDNSWYIAEPESFASGGFGAVYHVYSRIVINKGKIQVFPVEKIVKVCNLSLNEEERSDEIKSVKEEVKKLKEHHIEAKLIGRQDNQVYVIMKDCGQQIADCMPPKGKDFNFDESFNMAYGILNELFTLQSQNKVHRDLKPANICRYPLPIVDEKGKPCYQYIVIDFGATVKQNETAPLIGTPVYMPPESMLLGAVADFRYDIYALAGILIEIFGADPMTIKNANHPAKDVRASPYATNTLFCHGEPIPNDVDAALLKELKQLFEEMGHSNPDRRPDLEYIFKFISAIPYRRQLNRAINKEYDAISKFAQLMGVKVNQPRGLSSHRERVRSNDSVSASYDEFKNCVWLKSDREPKIDLLKDYGISSDHAYVVYDQKLYYVNARTESVELVIQHQTDLNNLLALLEYGTEPAAQQTVSVKKNSKTFVNLREGQSELLTDDHLAIIEKCTNHVPASTTLPISEQLIYIKRVYQLYNKHNINGLIKSLDDDANNELKQLFNKIGHSDTIQRPIIQYIDKFFGTLAYRNKLEGLVDKIEKNYLATKKLAKCIGVQVTKIEQDFSHNAEVTRLLTENKGYSYAYEHDYLILKIEDRPVANTQQYLSNFINNYNQFAECFTKKSARFIGTNSSGIETIRKILHNENLSILTKLNKIRSLGEDKRRSSLSNWYSRSHLFFGQGRHNNIDELYEKLRLLPVNPDNLSALGNTLNSIVEFIGNVENDFVFDSPRACC